MSIHRLNHTFAQVKTVITDVFSVRLGELQIHETGTVIQCGGGIARVSGLPSVRAEELLRFPGDVLGIALELGAEEISVILLGEHPAIVAGAAVYKTGRIADVPVGGALLGRVLNANGEVLDGGAPLNATSRLPMEREAPAIIHRSPVTTPLQTGIKSIDALIPIGLGQRELIVGDRQTGKTSIAVDTILNQIDKDVICIYCAIGQRGTAVARVINTLRDKGVLAQSIIVVAAGDDPPGLQFMTPYAATSIAEWFRDRGQNALIVYDDLTRHARVYREMSLLLRRPPGREAFPGDIFYIHARLLERSTHLKPELGGGSLTALPIVETQAQDLSAYIPTNLVSITDGQIYLSPLLFQKGWLPAVDTGKSVSRVGGKTQLHAFREVAGDLRLTYSQFEELESFSRFATRLDDKTRAAIERGQRLREVLKQREQHPFTVMEQIAVLMAVNEGLFDEFDLHTVATLEQVLCDKVNAQKHHIQEKIVSNRPLTEDDWLELGLILKKAVESYKSHHGST